MLMLYNSDSFAVVQFDIGRSPEDVNTPPRGGYEIVDKLARKEIFLDGVMAKSFREGICKGDGVRTFSSGANPRLPLGRCQLGSFYRLSKKSVGGPVISD